MTGMKEGAGEDPFAESPSDTNDAGKERTEQRRADSADAAVAESGSDSGSSSARADTQRRSMQIPYKFRRDSVQDDRERVPLFLMEDTKGAERDALRELEDRFDDDVSLTDLREAVVAVGLQHLDEVEGQLEEWGYGMTFSSE